MLSTLKVVKVVTFLSLFAICPVLRCYGADKILVRGHFAPRTFPQKISQKLLFFNIRIFFLPVLVPRGQRIGDNGEVVYEHA